ncbi:hypothetical protein GCM10017687_54660 [Streptomyces echinatus]
MVKLPGWRGAAQGEGSQDLAGAAYGGDGRGVDAGGVEQAALFDRDAGVRGALVGLGPGEGGGDAAQGSGQGHRGFFGDRRHRPLKVFVVDQAVVVGLDDGGAPHLVAFGDQVDDGPVRQPRQDQGHQPAQRLVHVQGGGQAGGGLGEQGQPLQFAQRFGGLPGVCLRVGGVLGVEDDECAGLAAGQGVGREGPRHGQQRAVGAGEVVPAAVRRESGVEGRAHAALRHRQGLALRPAVQQVVGVLPDEVAGGPFQQPFGMAVHRDDAALHVHGVGAGPDRFQGGGQPGRIRRGPVQAGLRVLLPCHVLASCDRLPSRLPPAARVAPCGVRTRAPCGVPREGLLYALHSQEFAPPPRARGLLSI